MQEHIIPWKRVGEPHILASGYGKSFMRQDFIDHVGNPTDFYFFDQPSWSVVLAITKSGTMLTVRQFKQGAEAILEELPGGQANFAGEDPAEVIQRELFEETGYRAEKVTALGSGYMNSRNSHTQFFCFLAEGCEKTADQNLDFTEQIIIAERPLTEWLSMMAEGAVTSLDACLTTVRALSHLGFTITQK